MLHIYVNKLGQHYFRKWLVTCLVPSHYLNQCWLIVNWTFRNNFQWNLNGNFLSRKCNWECSLPVTSPWHQQQSTNLVPPQYSSFNTRANGFQIWNMIYTTERADKFPENRFSKCVKLTLTTKIGIRSINNTKVRNPQNIMMSILNSEHE